MRALIITVSVILVLALAYFIYLKQLPSPKGTQIPPPNTGGSGNSQYSQSITIGDLMDGGQKVTVSASYPVGSTNVVYPTIDGDGKTWSHSWVKLDSAINGYKDELKIALDKASQEKYPTLIGGNRTKLYNVLQGKQYWKDLMNKVDNDPRLEQGVKDALKDFFRKGAWEMWGGTNTSAKALFQKAWSAIGPIVVDAAKTAATNQIAGSSSNNNGSNEMTA